MATHEPRSAVKLQDAVDSLYQIAVVQGKATSTKRLDSLAEFCIAELAKRGLDGAVTEAKLPDFSDGPRLLSGETAVAPFFDRLVADVRYRNPVLERAR